MTRDWGESEQSFVRFPVITVSTSRKRVVNRQLGNKWLITKGFSRLASAWIEGSDGNSDEGGRGLLEEEREARGNGC